MVPGADGITLSAICLMRSSIDDVSGAACSGDHLPVLLAETLEALQPRSGGRYLDATFGGGGHSRALLESAAGLRVLALDRDPEAAARAVGLQERYGERFSFREMNFAELDGLEASGFDGILFDFGLSSFQLDDASRGFSFREDAPVDMRMNPQAGRSAAEFLEGADEAELVRAVRDYGEEQRWRRVVRAILEARGTGRLQRTGSLAALVSQAVGAVPQHRRRLHPATRAFQGIRVEVNDELGAIDRGLPAAFDRLRPGGVLVAISFHSLEDRIVKRFCRQVAGRPEHACDSRPQEERETRAAMLATRPVKPSEAERQSNPRSRSARLRAVRKLPTPT